jgi:hypothetical protein
MLFDSSHIFFYDISAHFIHSTSKYSNIPISPLVSR